MSLLSTFTSTELVLKLKKTEHVRFNISVCEASVASFFFPSLPTCMIVFDPYPQTSICPTAVTLHPVNR
ncbi:hypothetical protein DPMN_184475 [Dreissena polymorpha]|uniref:Uncharacterized protein n=1 Tax=Dreissena polymorpha TaxID=45954 RepID=A0A9D4DLV4_DREPO|nr:hypothetical protein DPMN_184353 [Dreissena polymorpha]KAH3749959.1 hypothetical protein DPMN_184475 [Dreissena polymorpha]